MLLNQMEFNYRRAILYGIGTIIKLLRAHIKLSHGSAYNQQILSESYDYEKECRDSIEEMRMKT